MPTDFEFQADETHDDYSQESKESTFGGETDLWGSNLTKEELLGDDCLLVFDADVGAGILLAEEVEITAFFTIPSGNYSPDGLPPYPESAGPFLSSCIGDGQRIVLVGFDGGIATSDDKGETFTEQDSGVAETLRSVTYGNGEYIVVGDNGVVLKSSDGETWEREPILFKQHLLACVYEPSRKRFVAVGKDSAKFQRTNTTWALGGLAR